ncbi:regulatory iron-sulfur-containing complex subunit RicT [Rurimicrobium arvi]|uniref:Regulatory iron-sulfur-containing complex subunit RicT n=1 Tax=Rurimicrobium arvi TaxID=2049916 RepID=A0ABP8MM22_9BACT
MGCGNCGTGANGKPAGCKSNGGCSSGGCNKLNVFDWLGTIPLPGTAKPFLIVEVSFNNGSRKEYFKNGTTHTLHKGQWVTVEGVGGFDIGEVSLTGELVKLQMKKYGVNDQNTLKRILRPSSDEDMEIFNQNKSREREVMVRSRAIAKELKIDMKIGEVELQADGKKATFFYTAEHRVDFRELIKVFASEFKVKVEMKQIGARQESGKVGGIGSCGRELCCSTWLTDFKSVNTTAARYQSLSINQTKLSGQCGRLKCCLNYELDTYMDALRHFPTQADHIQTANGRANLIKKDIFRNLMWYAFSNSSKHYPLTIERVKEILAMNKEGKFPDELEPVELETKEKTKIDVGFVNDVGQISLRNLEKRKSKNKKKPSSGNNTPGNEAKQAKGPRNNNNNPGGKQQQAREKGQPQQNNQQKPRPQQGPKTEQVGKPQQAQPNQNRNNPPSAEGGAQQQQPKNRPPRPKRNPNSSKPEQPQKAPAQNNEKPS